MQGLIELQKENYSEIERIFGEKLRSENDCKTAANVLESCFNK